jgi:hypothetical protein
MNSENQDVPKRKINQPPENTNNTTNEINKLTATLMVKPFDPVL